MRCKTCKRPLTPLFTSLVCDWCDGVRQLVPAARGWILWSADIGPDGKELYVFPTREMAEHYRSQSRSADEIREVVSELPLRFVKGRGTIPDLELAEKLVTVYPDHRFEPGPYRAYLAPEPRASA